MTSKIKIFDQQFAHFGRSEGSFLAILGSKKSSSGFFQSYLVVV